jgi:nucleoside-diphosphate-sugar epimerase
MTICVTGGTGFLGSRVVAELLARGHRVRCAIRLAAKGAELAGRFAEKPRSRLQWIVGALDRSQFCRELLSGCDAVVHVAAPLVGSVPALFASGVIPTRVLVHAAADCGIRRFVLISSLAVYGTQDIPPGGVLDERCPIDRQPHLRDAYTYSKVAQEEVCWEAHNDRGLRLVVVRPGVLYGPGRPLLTPRVGLTVGGVLIQMGGRQRVPYCFVDSCARAIAMAVDAPSIGGMSFNVVDDNLPSSDEVLRLHRTHLAHIRRIKVPARAIGQFARLCGWCSTQSSGMFPPVLTPYKAAALWKRLQFSNELAKTRLGWRPLVTFEEGVRRTVQASAAVDCAIGT